MDFGKINKADGRIGLEEWQKVIDSNSSLQQAPDRKGVNPFTNEEIIFTGEGKAYYLENNEPAGNISLEEGELLTTGVPVSICEAIAKEFNAEVFEDDRS